MTSPADSLRSRRRSRRYSSARLRAAVAGGGAPGAFSNASSPSSPQIVVWNAERTEPRSASQFQPPSASCSLRSRSTSRSLRSPKYAPSATTRPLMHGSTSPSKKGESPNSGPQVTLSRTRSIAARVRALAGSTPKSRKNSSVYRLDHQNGVAVPSPHWPSGRCRSSSHGPHPSEVTRDRSAATISAGVSVRSRRTCQRIAGSASRSQSMTGPFADRGCASPGVSVIRSWPPGKSSCHSLSPQIGSHWREEAGEDAGGPRGGSFFRKRRAGQPPRPVIDQRKYGFGSRLLDETLHEGARLRGTLYFGASTVEFDFYWFRRGSVDSASPDASLGRKGRSPILSLCCGRLA